MLVLVQRPQHKCTPDPVAAPKNIPFGTIFIEFGDTKKCCTFSGLDSPEGFALLLGQCAALRSLAQSTTPFLASGKAKNGVFSLRIAHIALFYTINFFF